MYIYFMSAWTSCRQVMLMLMSYKDTIYYKSKYIIGTYYKSKYILGTYYKSMYIIGMY